MNREFIKGLHPLLRADLDSEWYAGATNIGGIVGNGRLTAGISLWGELSVLRWPSVSHFDQLRCRTVHGFPLRNYRVRAGEEGESPSYRRWGRPRLVSPGMGSFGGVFIEGSRGVEWLNGPSWEPSQRYWPGDSNVLVSKAFNRELDIRVNVTDLVVPDADVLARRFSFECGDAAGEARARFLYFANISPTKARARYYPVTWRLLERRSDLLALFDHRDDLILHFRPDAADPGSAGATAALLSKNPSAITDYIDQLDDEYPGGGVYIAWGGTTASSGHQVGLCSARRGAVEQHDAFFDAETGTLSGSCAAPRPANAALSFPLSLGPGRKEEVVIYLAAAGRASDTLKLIRDARSEGFEALRARASAFWSGFISKARMPPTGDAVADGIARRGILALAVGTDRESGSQVASISRQPQYCFDWPRDGAFFDYALDLAGYHDAVTRHAEFYIGVQLRRDRPRKRSGNFEAHYYTDGKRGPVPFFEIDETGLCAWDLWRHARFLSGEERDRYLAHAYPVIRTAADALMLMRPRAGGFPRRAHEDDNIFRRTRTLHGAASTYLGLRAAAEAGRQAGEEEDKVSEWTSWADELRDDMARRYDRDAGRFLPDGWRGRAWVIWPARILPPEDERVQAQAGYLMSIIEPFTMKECDGAAYVSEMIVACALAFRHVPEKLERVKRALEVMTREVPTPGTGHFGEVSLVGDFSGTGERLFQNRTAIPHLWEGVLMYLALAAAYAPEWFDEADAPFSW